MPERLSADDRAEIVETCSQFTWCMDERRWDDLGELLTDPVDIDYTSVFGGRPSRVSRADMVRNAQRLLGNLTATQHLVGGHTVSGAGDQAVCKSHVQATHYLATTTGDPLWTVGAQYHMNVSRNAGRWRICGIRAVLLWASGNREVMRLGKVAE